MLKLEDFKEFTVLSKNVLGGGKETGAGEKCTTDGKCMKWKYDYDFEDGQINYAGVTYTDECD
jgi:hypothetical protein